jgi:hypothetical protein
MGNHVLMIQYQRLMHFWATGRLLILLGDTEIDTTGVVRLFLPGLVGELLASPKGTQTSPSWFRTTGWMLKSFKKNEILM